MSELRRDPFTRGWVIIAPERGSRPQHTGPHLAPRQPAADPSCPFCPGREEETPAELWRSPGGGSHWAVRVVPNRYPVLSPGPLPPHHTAGLHTSCDGIGSHEVVIESPRHDWDLADGDTAAVAAVLHAYRARIRALRERGSGLILPFRNHGPGAGTSLAHPHSQIVATPNVPLRIRQLLDVARAHYDDHGTCLYQDEAAAEIDDGERVIDLGDHLAVLAPYAARAPYETWIVPRSHQASFADVTDQVLDETAHLLLRLLNALRHELGDVAYNYALLSAPGGEESTAYFTWHLQLLPRLTTTAGFELGSGMAVNPVPPETSASRLRHALSQPVPDGARPSGACRDSAGPGSMEV